eukprot:scaffold52885_cov42-Prasinocladus_malaysianus.AAC.1
MGYGQGLAGLEVGTKSYERTANQRTVNMDHQGLDIRCWRLCYSPQNMETETKHGRDAINCDARLWPSRYSYINCHSPGDDKPHKGFKLCKITRGTRLGI